MRILTRYILIELTIAFIANRYLSDFTPLLVLLGSGVIAAAVIGEAVWAEATAGIKAVEKTKAATDPNRKRRRDGSDAPRRQDNELTCE